MDISNILYPVLSLGGMGILFGLGLGYAGKKFHVEEDPNIGLVRNVLPGANCGGCGFPGCDGFAAAVCSGKADPSGCPVGGSDTAVQVSDILGIEVVVKEREAAFVKCAGTCDTAEWRYDYSGFQDCSAVMQLSAGGPKNCSYGCLGAGSCARACPYDAITVTNNIAVVDKDKCVACSICVGVCPKSLIELVPVSKDVRVVCNSKDNGKIARGNCKVACIGCKMCAKACEFDAVHIENFIATVDYEKCTQCNKCTEKCPTKAIANLK